MINPLFSLLPLFFGLTSIVGQFAIMRWILRKANVKQRVTLWSAIITAVLVVLELVLLVWNWDVAMSA